MMTFSNLLLIDENGKSLNVDYWSTQGIDPELAQIPEYVAIKSMVTGCTMAFSSSLLDFALPSSLCMLFSFRRIRISQLIYGFYSLLSV